MSIEPQPTSAAPADAVELLVQASDAIHQRAALRDQPTGERSMARAVAAFNALHDTRMTEREGWEFMAVLKLARANGGTFHVDDYIDMAAYAGLAGEAAGRVAQLRDKLAAAERRTWARGAE